MSVENKPEIVADPIVTPEPSTEQVVQQRMSEARQEIESVSNLIPKDQTGGAADVSTQEDTSNSSNTDAGVLKTLEASTGRKFESIADFNKHYSSLNSLVGDAGLAKARKASETLEKWERQFGKAAPELEKLLADTAIALQTPQVATPEQSKPQPVVEQKPQQVVNPSDDELTKRLDLLEHVTQLSALEKKYPSATSVAEEVSLIAKSKGISYVEAFELSPLKQLVELKDKEESAKSPVVTPSNRTNVDYKNLEQLGLKVMSGRAKESEQISFAKEFFKTRGRDI